MLTDYRTAVTGIAEVASPDKLYLQKGFYSKTPKQEMPLPNYTLLIRIDQTDQVLTLGFPGQTLRQESSYAINFYRNHRNPVLIATYKAILKARQRSARNNPSIARKNTPTRITVAQNLTYYTQLQSGFESDSIASQKVTVEEQFADWFKKDSLRNIQNRRVLATARTGILHCFTKQRPVFALVQMLNYSKLLQIAGL